MSVLYWEPVENAGYHTEHCLKIFSKDVMWFHFKSFLPSRLQNGTRKRYHFCKKKKKSEKAFMYIDVYAFFKSQ